MGQERNRWREGWLNNEQRNTHSGVTELYPERRTERKKEKERRKKKEEPIGEAAVFGIQRIISFGDKRFELMTGEVRKANSFILRDV